MIFFTPNIVAVTSELASSSHPRLHAQPAGEGAETLRGEKTLRASPAAWSACGRERWHRKVRGTGVGKVGMTPEPASGPHTAPRQQSAMERGQGRRAPSESSAGASGSLSLSFLPVKIRDIPCPGQQYTFHRCLWNACLLCARPGARHGEDGEQKPTVLAHTCSHPRGALLTGYLPWVTLP